jgi:protein SCO1/2
MAAIGSLTRGFEHWTFEDLRVARAQHGELRAPPTATRSSRGDDRVLFADKVPRAVYLVDFIYTSCPGVCQALGSEYHQMQQALISLPSPGVRLVSLSFDGARDGQAELAAYASLHRARPDLWQVAKPMTQAATQELLRHIGVVTIADGWGGYAHNGDIHLIDGAGVVHGIFAFDQWSVALAAARRLAAAAP